MRFLLLFCTVISTQLYGQIYSERCGDCGGSNRGNGAYRHPNAPARGDQPSLFKKDDYSKNRPKAPYQPLSQSIQNINWNKIYEEQNKIQEIKDNDYHDVIDITAVDSADTAFFHAQLENQNTHDHEMIDIYYDIGKKLLDISTSTFPPTSVVRDIYEAVTGQDFFSNEKLSTFERSMAVLGAATFGYGDKALKAAKAIEKVASHYPFAKQTFNAVENSVKLLHEKSFTELKETVRFIKKWGIKFKDKAIRTDWVNSFFKNSKVDVLKEDKILYRYYTEGKNEARWTWLTDKLTDTPQADLALKYAPADVKGWIAPKGTEVLHSVVAPKHGQPGCGYQYYVPDSSVLKEIIE